MVVLLSWGFARWLILPKLYADDSLTEFSQRLVKGAINRRQSLLDDCGLCRHLIAECVNSIITLGEVLANAVVALLHSGRECGKRSEMLIVVLSVLSLRAGDVFIKGLHLRSEVGDLRIDDADCLVVDLAGDGLNLCTVLVGSLAMLVMIQKLKLGC